MVWGGLVEGGLGCFNGPRKAAMAYARIQKISSRGPDNTFLYMSRGM